MLMYFPTLDTVTGRLLTLAMVPIRLRKLKLNRASASEAEWLQERVSQGSAAFGCGVELLRTGGLTLQWGKAVCSMNRG